MKKYRINWNTVKRNIQILTALGIVFVMSAYFTHCLINGLW